jgi:hypothetical protein
VHTAAAHLRAATRAGLRLARHQHGAVGPAVESFYTEAGRLDLFRQHLGLRIVLAMAWTR